jgi:DNA-binding winged helix-turn-helix (wHTH) protein/TolB-like protein/Flp pilus assembly protein TadD
MADPRPAHLRFGPFVCDVSTGELWKAGRPIKLQEQPRQLLVALLRQPGEVLSRDQLRQHLWPDGTFVDFDNALNVGIRRIREALGDTAPTARYVETVRGLGYRFIAPVVPDRAAEGELAAPAPLAAPATVVEAAWYQRLSPALVVVAIVTAFAVAFPLVRSQAGTPQIESLAVLPFDNLLANEDRQYLVDALREAISERLAARGDVRVITSRSVYEVTDRNAPRQELARRLGADALVLGSVAQAGAGFVINARLVDGRSDRILWSGRFERAPDQVHVPDEIVAAVAVGIGRLSPAPSPTRVTRVVAPEARDAYLRGRFFWAKRGQANSVTAVRYLSAAIELQRDYAEAWAGLADVYAVYEGAPSPVIVPWPGDSTEGGLMAAREALRLNPDLGEAHAALAKLYVGRRRWSEAEQSFARAIELSPQYSTARQWYGTMFARLGRCDEAIEQVKQGARLDPLTALVNEAVGSVYLECGELQRAIDVFDSVLSMHPTAHTTRYRRAQALGQLGRHDDAIRELTAVITAVPSDSTGAALAVAYVNAGNKARARQLLATLTVPFLRARVFAALRDRERMFDQLERSLKTDSGGLQNLVTSGEFEPYRQDPRFVDFAARAGFPLPLRSPRFSAGTQSVRAAR